LAMKKGGGKKKGDWSLIHQRVLASRIAFVTWRNSRKKRSEQLGTKI